MTWTPETWMRQRGTWPTTAAVLVRDLRIPRTRAATQLCRLARRGLAVRISSGRYLHRDTFPETAMATLILYGHDGAERHRAEFPTRVRADIALRVVERDLATGRSEVRIVGPDHRDPLYTVSGVARAAIMPAPRPDPPLPTASEPDETPFDARARAAGGD